MMIKPCSICGDAQNLVAHISFNDYEVGNTYIVLKCVSPKHGNNPYIVDKELVSSFALPSHLS